MDQDVTHPAGPICYPSIRSHRGEQSKYHRHRREGRVDRSGVAVARLSGLRAVSRYQWLVFLVVWLGWTLDAADFGLYSLVLKPAMTELLAATRRWPISANMAARSSPGSWWARLAAALTGSRHSLLCAVEHHRNAARPRNHGRPAATIARLTTAACRLGPADRSGAWADPGSCGPRAGRF